MWRHVLRPKYVIRTIDLPSPCPGHDGLIKWKHFPRYWPFVRGIHRSPVNSLHKGQWRGPLMFCLICTWINGWVNNREAGELRRHRAHYDVIVVIFCCLANDVDCFPVCCGISASYQLLPNGNLWYYALSVVMVIEPYTQINRIAENWEVSCCQHCRNRLAWKVTTMSAVTTAPCIATASAEMTLIYNIDLWQPVVPPWTTKLSLS